LSNLVFLFITGRKKPPVRDEDWFAGNWQPTEWDFTATPGPSDVAAELLSEDPVDFTELFLGNNNNNNNNKTLFV